MKSKPTQQSFAHKSSIIEEEEHDSKAEESEPRRNGSSLETSSLNASSSLGNSITSDDSNEAFIEIDPKHHVIKNVEFKMNIELDEEMKEFGSKSPHTPEPLKMMSSETKKSRRSNSLCDLFKVPSIEWPTNNRTMKRKPTAKFFSKDVKQSSKKLAGLVTE